MKFNNKNITVLVADDEATNRLVVKIALQKENYNLVEATNGLEAVEMAKKYNPSLILMDAIMPKMDGFEAIRNIKAIPELENIPILMITALDSQEDKIKAFKSGANDYLNKPFDMQELILRVRSFVQMRELYIQNVKARIDPIYNLPNVQALRDRVEKVKYPNGLFFQIKEFENIIYLYGVVGVRIIVKDLLHKIQLSCEVHNSEIFVLNEDTFVIFWITEDKMEDDRITYFAKKVYENVKKLTYGNGFVQSDLTVHIVANHNVNDFLQIGRLSLKDIMKKNIPYAIADKIYKDMAKNIEYKMEMIKYIKKAIDEDRVIPVYQAIMDAKTKEVHKYECLVRIKKEDGSLMSPFFFLEIAKESEQYPEITRIMIEKTFAFMQDKDLEFSINLSSIDMEDDNLVKYLFTKLDEYQVHNRVIIELLEDESIHNFDTVLNFIKEVKKLGIKIAIDDYGSGYSNLERIFQFEPDFLKIDGSIIKGIATDETKLAIAKSAVFLSKELGIKTVGEFISEKELFDKADEIDIDFFQGYYISEPLEEI